MATVLVLEDEPLVAGFIRTVLQSSGHQVVEARTAEEAVQLAEHEIGRFDVLVADVIVRDARGPAIARRLRHTQPLMACLFISGYPLEELKNDALLGSTDPTQVPRASFLPKPFSAERLRQAIAALLESPLG